jgi:phosphinothricin acetyltransferase
VWEECVSDTEFLKGVVIRDCVEEDIPAITAIYRHAVLNSTGTFEIDPPGEAEMKIRRRVMLASNYPYLVAESDRKLVGYAYANSYRPREAYGKTIENSVYIREGFHGRGIGQKLLAALIDAAAERGFRQMIAVIGDAENAGSIRLHEKLGFARAGVLRAVGHKHERWLDTILMQLELPSVERDTI